MRSVCFLLVAGVILAGIILARADAAHPADGIVRGIYADPGAAVDNRLWGAFGADYELDTNEKHEGKVSIRCANESDKEAHGAFQSIRFEQDNPRPIVISGWAKLEGVSGPADYRCSIYLDLTLKGGESWPMKIAAFDPAKKGWQYAEQTYSPPKPFESGRVYVFLREKNGVAWFDDISVCEVLDEKGTRSKNLLADPGFEGNAPGDTTLREKFFGKLKEIGCNAFHIYRGVGWEKVMGTGSTTPPGALPSIDPKDLLLDFINDAHRRRFKVWLTVGLGLPNIQNTKSPEFPFWPCINNRWGEAYTRAVGYFAQYGVDGIGVVPDEWNLNTGDVHAWAKHSDPDVAKFYSTIPPHCNCEVCRSRFRQQFGRDYPDVTKLWSTADPVWADYTKFRYDSTSAWMKRSVEAAHRINPKIVTDTMICVLPVCSDDRRATGAAWDQIGVETGLDCLQTDPYIQLHNYLGDSTHYYPTETTLHLTSANWKGRSGVTLESCRLYEQYRDKEPVEVYGSALSCLTHGATEFFWWHGNFLEGRVKFVDPVPPSRQLAAVYEVMQKMESDVLKCRVPGETLVLYSRASEDSWHWLAGKGVLPEVFDEKPNPKRGFVAHRNVLYWLLRRGYPFQMAFLDSPDPQRLKAAKVLIVPFPFSLRESEVKVIEDQARSGKTVVLLSELSPVDERGQPLPTPRLTRLLGAQKVDAKSEGIFENKLSRGRVVFLGGDFAARLFAETKPEKDPKATVPLPAFDEVRTATLERAITLGTTKPVSLFATKPAQDVEATLLEGSNATMLLLINWNFTSPATVQLRRAALAGAKRVDGYAILRDSTVKEIHAPCSGDPWTVELAPQEARLLNLSN